jgi:peptide/nickel transport system permease protein
VIKYVIGRLLQLIPVLFGISIIVFFLVRLIPGDPAISMLGSRATPELVARVRDQLGLDLPLWQQYFHYIGRAFQGDFGISFFYQTGVWEITMSRVSLTLLLMGYSTFIALLLAVPFATIAALRKDRPTDHVIRLTFTAGLGIPSFWLGIMLALLIGVKLGLLPIAGKGSGGLDTIRHLALPALTIAIYISPIMMRTLRSSLIEVIQADYITTGRAMGVKRTTLLFSYLLRNSLKPLVTVLSINIGMIISGTVIIEQVFSLPGLGSLLIGSITTRDYSIIQLVTLVFAVLVVLVNLLADLMYSALDPRITLAR